MPSCVSWLRGPHCVMRTLGHHDEKCVHLCDEPSKGSLAHAGKWAQYVCLCTGTAISSIPWILHTSGGTLTSRGLWRNWVGGDWLFLNKRGDRRAVTGCITAPACCVFPRSHARKHRHTRYYRRGLMTDKNIWTPKALHTTHPGTMFSLQPLHAHVIPASINGEAARMATIKTAQDEENPFHTRMLLMHCPHFGGTVHVLKHSPNSTYAGLEASRCSKSTNKQVQC